jgi:hypothetical protein
MILQWLKELCIWAPSVSSHSKLIIKQLTVDISFFCFVALSGRKCKTFGVVGLKWVCCIDLWSPVSQFKMADPLRWKQILTDLLLRWCPVVVKLIEVIVQEWMIKVETGSDSDVCVCEGDLLHLILNVFVDEYYLYISLDWYKKFEFCFAKILALFWWSGGQNVKKMNCYNSLALEVSQKPLLRMHNWTDVNRDELQLERIVVVVYGHSCDWKFLDILVTRTGTTLVLRFVGDIHTGIYIIHLMLRAWLFTVWSTEQITCQGHLHFHSKITVIKHESLKIPWFSCDQIREEEKPYPYG